MALNPTHNLQEVLNLAQEVAEECAAAELRPEHLLLGLLRKGACRAMHLLVNLNVELPLFEATLRHRVEQLDLEGHASSGGEPLAPHASTLKLYETLETTTENMGLHQQGTDHLLYALLKHPEFPATQLMTEHGLNAENLFREMLRFNNTVQVTPELSELIAQARAIAGQMGAARIGPEHLLTALLGQSGSRALRLLQGQGVDLDALREAARLIARTSNRPTTPPVGFDLAAGQLLAEAESIARALAPIQLGPEYLLLSLLQGHAPTAELLTGAGVSHEVLFLQALVTSTRRRGFEI